MKIVLVSALRMTKTLIIHWSLMYTHPWPPHTFTSYPNALKLGMIFTKCLNFKSAESTGACEYTENYSLHDGRFFSCRLTSRKGIWNSNILCWTGPSWPKNSIFHQVNLFATFISSRYQSKLSKSWEHLIKTVHFLEYNYFQKQLVKH